MRSKFKNAMHMVLFWGANLQENEELGTSEGRNMPMDDNMNGNENIIKYLYEYYNMLYPKNFKEKEKIRLLAIHKDSTCNGKTTTITRYVNNFSDYKDFILKYRCQYDIYNQLATVKPVKQKDGYETYGGGISNQRLRKVLFLDFDLKDYPDYDTSSAADFSNIIKEKIPNLFLHACTMSGHGFHFYISVEPLVKNLHQIIETNKKLASLIGADIKAASPTQIDRPPCSYNHKQPDGSYDYDRKENWQIVTLVNCAYEKGSQFRAYDLNYIEQLIKNAYRKDKRQQILKKQAWDYTGLDEYKKYLCNWRVFYEGADKGQRNFWHGRIVKTLQLEGYQPSKIYSMCKDWNSRCRPPKSESEIEADTKRYLESDYKLLGCYQSISDTIHREWVKTMCDKAECSTYHNGAVISIEKRNGAKIHNSALKNRDLQTMTGDDYLILTLLDVYKNSYGRRGFRIRNLKERLYSDIQKKQAINDRTLKNKLLHLQEKNWIVLSPDNKSAKFDEYKITLSRRLKDFKDGKYIQFYFSIANCLINGLITQRDYLVYLALIRNLSEGKSVSYEQLSDDLKIDKSNIGKSIKNLERQRCIVLMKDYNEKSREFNKYHIINPDTVQLNDEESRNNLVLKLLA